MLSLIVCCVHPAEARAVAAHLRNCRRMAARPWAFTAGTSGTVRIAVLGNDYGGSLAELWRHIGLESGLLALSGAPPPFCLFGAAGALSDDFPSGCPVQGNPVLTENDGSVSRPTITFDLPVIPLLSVSQPVLPPSERQQMWLNTGAQAVDMESATFAQFCSAHLIPWATVRVIVDTPANPATYPYPPLLQQALQQGARRFVHAMTTIATIQGRKFPSSGLAIDE